MIYVRHLQDVPSNLFNPTSVPQHAPSDRALYRTSSLPLPRRISVQSVSDHPRQSSRAHCPSIRPSVTYTTTPVPAFRPSPETQDPPPPHKSTPLGPYQSPIHSPLTPLPAFQLTSYLLLLLLPLHPLLSRLPLHLPLNLLLPIPPRPLLPLCHLPRLRRRLARRGERLPCRECLV